MNHRASNLQNYHWCRFSESTCRWSPTCDRIEFDNMQMGNIYRLFIIKITIVWIQRGQKIPRKNLLLIFRILKNWKLRSNKLRRILPKNYSRKSTSLINRKNSSLKNLQPGRKRWLWRTKKMHLISKRATHPKKYLLMAMSELVPWSSWKIVHLAIVCSQLILDQWKDPVWHLPITEEQDLIQRISFIPKNC